MSSFGPALRCLLAAAAAADGGVVVAAAAAAEVFKVVADRPVVVVFRVVAGPRGAADFKGVAARGPVAECLVADMAAVALGRAEACQAVVEVRP